MHAKIIHTPIRLHGLRCLAHLCILYSTLHAMSGWLMLSDDDDFAWIRVRSIANDLEISNWLAFDESVAGSRPCCLSVSRC